MISVVIPVHNSEKTLDRCITALLRSGFDTNELEIIIVDDCSIDGSPRIAARYPVKLLRLKQNSGAAVARNYGSAHAAGDILFFIDSDVFVEPDVLRKIDAIFRNNTDVDAVVGAYLPRQPNDDFYSLYQTAFTYYNHENCPEGAIHWFWGACGAIRAAVFHEIGRFNETYRGAGAEDIEIGYDLSDGGYRIVLDKSIHVVHCHAHTFGSIMRNNLKKSSEWCALFLSKNTGNRYKHGFTSARNGMSIILAWLTLLFVILAAAGIDSRPWLVASIAGLLIVNRGFYFFLYHLHGRGFLIRSLLFHWITSLGIGIGILLGIFRFIIKKKERHQLPVKTLRGKFNQRFVS